MRAAPALLVLTLVACASKPPSPSPSAETSVRAPILEAGAPPAVVSRVRWEPMEWVSWEGRKGYIAAGHRVARDAAGDRVLDPADPPLRHALKVPPTLGRGYVFLGSRDVYVSERFDGPLHAVAKQASHPGRDFVGIGFDSIYLEGSPGGLARYELPSGRATPMDPPDALRVVGHPAGYVVAVVNGKYLFADGARKWKSLNLNVDSRSGGHAFWDPEEGVLVSTPKGYFAVDARGKTKPGRGLFASELSTNGAFVERGSDELDAIGDPPPRANVDDAWDERLEGDVVALKHATCSGAKSKANALCIKRRDGKWSDAWTPDLNVDWSFAIWASKNDKLLGLVGSNRMCALVAPLERKHVELPCPGFTASGEAHRRGSITASGALRVVLGRVRGLGISELSLDGKVVDEELSPHVEASMAGRRGLLVLTDRSLVETNDDGRTWAKVPSPPFGASQVEFLSGDSRGWLGACSEAGCRLTDGTRRVGWELP